MNAFMLLIDATRPLTDRCDDPCIVVAFVAMLVDPSSL